MMSLARICLLFISGPGCLVQCIILNQIKIPLHPQVNHEIPNVIMIMISNWIFVLSCLVWLFIGWRQSTIYLRIFALAFILCIGFQNMHVLSSLFYDLHIKAHPPLDVLWSKPGKMISPEYQNMISLQVNNTATLVCENDLRGEPLYSVKW